MARVSLQPSLLRALRRPTAQLPRCTPAPATTPSAARSFSHLPTLRPTLLSKTPSVFRAPNQTPTTTATLFPSPTTATTTATGEVLDLLPKSFFTAHPALAGCASQIRCGPRPTMSGATRLVQKRRHGFLSRVRTQKGRNTLARRRAKGRKKLGH